MRYLSQNTPISVRLVSNQTPVVDSKAIGISAAIWLPDECQKRKIQAKKDDKTRDTIYLEKLLSKLFFVRRTFAFEGRDPKRLMFAESSFGVFFFPSLLFLFLSSDEQTFV